MPRFGTFKQAKNLPLRSFSVWRSSFNFFIYFLCVGQFTTFWRVRDILLSVLFINYRSKTLAFTLDKKICLFYERVHTQMKMRVHLMKTKRQMTTAGPLSLYQKTCQLNENQTTNDGYSLASCSTAEWISLKRIFVDVALTQSNCKISVSFCSTFHKPIRCQIKNFTIAPNTNRKIIRQLYLFIFHTAIAASHCIQSD